jgi:hypothetical protein
MSNQDAVKATADSAYNVMHELGRDVPYSCPAPTVYSVLGNLKNSAGWFTAHAADTLAGGLRRSLEDFDVYDHKREPAESVEMACGHLERAANLARQLAAELEQAQTAINSQGYRSPGDHDYREPEDRK